jgi:hypothetical protein
LKSCALPAIGIIVTAYLPIFTGAATLPAPTAVSITNLQLTITSS